MKMMKTSEFTAVIRNVSRLLVSLKHSKNSREKSPAFGVGGIVKSSAFSIVWDDESGLPGHAAGKPLVPGYCHDGVRTGIAGKYFKRE